MTLKELTEHLDELVYFKDDRLGIDGIYRYKGCIIRRNQYGICASAELFKQENSMIVASVNKIRFIDQTEKIREEYQKEE